MECPWPDHGGGNPLTPVVSGHLSILFITGRGTGTKTCGKGSVFPPDDICIGLDTFTNCILIYDLFLNFWLMGCATCFICINWWGKAHVGLPFPGTGCSVPDVASIYFISNVYCMDFCFYNCPPPPRMFPPTDFRLEKRIGLDSMDLPCIIFTYYTQDNQQECFRLSNWFPLRCLGPWINHLPLCDGPILGLCF